MMLQSPCQTACLILLVPMLLLLGLVTIPRTLISEGGGLSWILKIPLERTTAEGVAD